MGRATSPSQVLPNKYALPSFILSMSSWLNLLWLPRAPQGESGGQLQTKDQDNILSPSGSLATHLPPSWGGTITPAYFYKEGLQMAGIDELAYAVQVACGGTKADAELAVRTVFKTLEEGVMDVGMEFQIRGFGTFSPKLIRAYSNGLCGDIVARQHLHFLPSKKTRRLAQ